MFPEAPHAVFWSELSWEAADRRVGGLSALIILSEGTHAWALSDKGHLLALDITRQGDALADVALSRSFDLTKAPGGGGVFDSEGLATDLAGNVLVSFEQQQRILRFSPETGALEWVTTPPAFSDFGKNKGLEAVAADQNGIVYTLPERPPTRRDGFPIWRWDGQMWDQPFRLPSRGGFLAVSAEIGPEGRFYLLERRLTFLGFQTRLRRWDLSSEAMRNETTLLVTPAGRFGNLEGLSLWRDGAQRMRASMVSDNNFWPVLPMQLVEFVLTE